MESTFVVGHTVVDLTDSGSLLAAAKQVAATRHVDGVLCWDELKMENTARIAVELGVPGDGPDVIDRCRDKHRTRQALAVARIPQPRSLLTGSIEEAEAAGAKIGYPVVLKPRALGASMGVTLVGSPEELKRAYAHTRDQHVSQARRYARGVLVEEFADGAEISVDSAVAAGVTTPLVIARKTSGFAPYFEETGHLVDGKDPLLGARDLREVLDGTHRALGFSTGITHVELRQTAEGWRVIEVNCRLGGDLIPYLGLLARGIDAGKAAAAIACGRAPLAAAVRQQAAAIRFWYPETAVTVGEIRIEKNLLPPEAVLATPLATPGQELVPPPQGHVWSRYAMVVTVGANPERCIAALDEADLALQLVPR